MKEKEINGYRFKPIKFTCPDCGAIDDCTFTWKESNRSIQQRCKCGKWVGCCKYDNRTLSEKIENPIYEPSKQTIDSLKTNSIMQKLFYGQINLTKLGQIVKQHPELVKEFDSKDGKQKVININVLGKEEADKYGNTGCVTVACKKEQQKLGTSAYFVGDLKPSGEKNEKPKTPSIDEPIPPLFDDNNNDLPF